MEVQKIISRYVYLFKSTKKKYLVYSSCFNSFLEVSENLHQKIEACQKDPALLNSLNETTRNTLEKNGIVVDSNADELFILKHQYLTHASQHNMHNLGLVLVPTLDCNFSCPYCFEKDKRATTMTEEVITNLFQFIKKHHGAKSLNITWYGGEPLLAFDVIKTILNKISEDLNIPLRKHSIITNGYLIDDDVIDLFKRYPLDSVQITLDGQPSRHNVLRKNKVNEGISSYDKIISNIRKVVQELPDTEVHVRVNIDKTNIQDYYKINEEIRSFTDSKKVVVYPGRIRIENSTCTGEKPPTISREEMADLEYEMCKKGMIDKKLFPTTSLIKTCSATRANSYIVGPEGEIYKCWNDVSNKTRVLGNINEDQLTNISLFYQYLEGCSWYNDTECRSCFFLPICNGKCAWYNLFNLYGKGEFKLCQCNVKHADNLDKHLEEYYESQACNESCSK